MIMALYLSPPKTINHQLQYRSNLNPSLHISRISPSLLQILGPNPLMAIPPPQAPTHSSIISKISRMKSNLGTKIEATNQANDSNLHNQLDLLLKSEEEYWRQRSKLTAVTERDKNRKFFHSHVKHKAKIKNIFDLKDLSGNLILGEEEIRNHCRNCFVDLFNPTYHSNSTSTQPTFESLQHISTTFTPEQITKLNIQFSSDEVKIFIFQMSHYKSPGLDGFPAEFYQNNWDTVGNDVINATLEFLNNGFILKEINNTFITLIPKIDIPNSIGDYRSISLCNIVYKIAYKVLIN
ncbi:hypothetical protein LIER_17995 [Lithospermum erythrorhizon]|uniref:Reverse transcriptase domain-containing protein n=1 Tax=Lithospermum erythrorhizon TaxID=34254 RepID=A0AAV3QFL3_LITER